MERRKERRNENLRSSKKGRTARCADEGSKRRKGLTVRKEEGRNDWI